MARSGASWSLNGWNLIDYCACQASNSGPKNDDARSVISHPKWPQHSVVCRRIEDVTYSFLGSGPAIAMMTKRPFKDTRS